MSEYQMEKENNVYVVFNSDENGLAIKKDKDLIFVCMNSYNI